MTKFGDSFFVGARARAFLTLRKPEFASDAAAPDARVCAPARSLARAFLALRERFWLCASPKFIEFCFVFMRLKKKDGNNNKWTTNFNQKTDFQGGKKPLLGKIKKK